MGGSLVETAVPSSFPGQGGRCIATGRVTSLFSNDEFPNLAVMKAYPLIAGRKLCKHLSRCSFASIKQRRVEHSTIA